MTKHHKLEALHKATHSPSAAEYSAVNIALLSQYPDGVLSDCLSDEELTELVENKVGLKKRSELYAHLDQCNTCRMRWQELAAIKERRESAKKKWLTGSSLIALAACALFVFSMYSSGTSVPGSVEDLYSMLGKDGALSNNKLDSFKMVASRGDTGRESSQKKDFDAGWEAGMSQLTVSSKRVFSEKDNSIYYYLGRWVAAATYVRLQGKVSTSAAYNELGNTLSAIRTEFVDIKPGAGNVPACLDSLQQFFQQAGNPLESVEANEQLRQLLDRLEESIP